MNRISAVEKELVRTNALTSLGRAVVAIQAADAHDRANGIHRIALDDATVERAARALYASRRSRAACECCFVDWDGTRESNREQYREDVRVVLAAAVKEEQA